MQTLPLREGHGSTRLEQSAAGVLFVKRYDPDEVQEADLLVRNERSAALALQPFFPQVPVLRDSPLDTDPYELKFSVSTRGLRAGFDLIEALDDVIGLDELLRKSPNPALDSEGRRRNISRFWDQSTTEMISFLEDLVGIYANIQTEISMVNNDVKPSNVLALFGSDGIYPQVVDWGLQFRLDHLALAELRPKDFDVARRFVLSASTPKYSAPEKRTLRSAFARGQIGLQHIQSFATDFPELFYSFDWWSLGMLASELLGGTAHEDFPVDAPTSTTLMVQTPDSVAGKRYDDFDTFRRENGILDGDAFFVSRQYPARVERAVDLLHQPAKQGPIQQHRLTEVRDMLAKSRTEITRGDFLGQAVKLSTLGGLALLLIGGPTFDGVERYRSLDRKRSVLLNEPTISYETFSDYLAELVNRRMRRPLLRDPVIDNGALTMVPSQVENGVYGNDFTTLLDAGAYMDALLYASILTGDSSYAQRFSEFAQLFPLQDTGSAPHLRIARFDFIRKASLLAQEHPIVAQALTPAVHDRFGEVAVNVADVIESFFLHETRRPHFVSTTFDEGQEGVPSGYGVVRSESLRILPLIAHICEYPQIGADRAERFSAAINSHLDLLGGLIAPEGLLADEGYFNPEDAMPEITFLDRYGTLQDGRLHRSYGVAQNLAIRALSALGKSEFAQRLLARATTSYATGSAPSFIGAPEGPQNPYPALVYAGTVAQRSDDPTIVDGLARNILQFLDFSSDEGLVSGVRLEPSENHPNYYMVSDAAFLDSAVRIREKKRKIDA